MPTVLLVSSNLPHQDMNYDALEQITYRMVFTNYGQSRSVCSIASYTSFMDKTWRLGAHAITKEQAAVPSIDLKRAIERKNLFEENPDAHTYVEEEEDGEE